MPTIDQLSPATAALDSDEFLISQGGVAKKIARAQILAGVQPQLALASGTLTGRSSPGTGPVETIAVGSNLALNGGTLSASSIGYNVSQLSAGVVPAAADLVPLGQPTNVAITYGQFLSGLPNVPNVDASQTVVTPSGSKTSSKLADLVAGFVPASGGTLTGVLSLAAAPISTMQAATKGYVDGAIATTLPKTGGSLSGALSLAADPTTALQASTKNYVDAQAATLVAKSGGTLSGNLMLAGDPTSALQAATRQYVDTRVSRGGDTLAGALVLAADPVTSLQASTKGYVDSLHALAVWRVGGTLTGSLGLAADPATALQAATKQYVDARVFRAGDTLTGTLTLAADPTTSLQAATKSYVDALVATAVPRSGGTVTGALTLSTDPSSGMQSATKQYVDARMLRSGDTLTGPLLLAADPISGLQAATKNYVDLQVASGTTKSGGSVSGSLTLAADPTTALGAATKQYVDTRVLRSGDTLSGALTLAADPTSAMQAATKGYTDTQVATALPRSGGSVTGSLVLSADPTSASQAATKRYVDGQIAGSLSLSGGTLTGQLTLVGTPAQATQAANKQYVDTQVATALPLAGGTVSGALTLATTPTLSAHAATKQYVDTNAGATGVINVKLPPYNAKLNGTVDDTAAFKAAYLAAPAGSVVYVPNGVTVLQQPGSWGISLLKRVKWVVDGTTLADGTPLSDSIPIGTNPASFVLPGVVTGNSSITAAVSQGGSQIGDFAVQHSSYISNHNGGSSGAVATNSRTDTVIYNSPNNYVWGGLDRLVWAGIQTPTLTTSAQHVGRYVQTIRQTIATDSNGQPLPQPQLWSACLEYRDATGHPSSWANAAITIEMDWYGNGLDDAGSRQIQSLVIGQHDPNGAPVEVSTVIGVYLGAGSSGHAVKVFNVAVPFSGAVLDTTYAQQMTGASAIRMAAGHAIAFEATGNYRLAYDSASNTLRWNQGSLSYVVGKGISVGWYNVCSGNTTLPNYIAGNIVFLVGGGAYTVSLPAASTVAAGTGYTFSALGGGNVTIAPNSTDQIDASPVILRQYDRYHIVSDGSGTWREIFRTNSVNPRCSGTLFLPSYTVSTLPSQPGAGAKAFAANGRKPGEVAGSGTGVEVFNDGTRWISVCSGAQVAA